MTKLEEYADYLIEDPNDSERSIFRIDISIANAAINLGGIELFATAKGWNGEGNAADYAIAWVKTQSHEGLYKYVELAGDAAEAAAMAQVQGLI